MFGIRNLCCSEGFSDHRQNRGVRSGCVWEDPKIANCIFGYTVWKLEDNKNVDSKEFMHFVKFWTKMNFGIAHFQFTFKQTPKYS